MNECARILAEIETFPLRYPDAMTEQAHQERRQFSALLKAASPSDVKLLAIELTVKDGAWQRYFAYEILLHHKPPSQSLTEQEVIALGQGIDTWGDVDTFGCYIAGPAWRSRQAQWP